VGDGDHDQGDQEQQRVAILPVTLRIGWSSLNHRRASSAEGPLLSAPTAFAVPAAFGVAQPLPAVLANPTEPGLCHGYLLSQKPFWFGEGDLQGPSISDGVETSPAGTTPLLSAGKALAVPAAVGVVQSLPGVESDSAAQGLGKGGVFGQEPFRFL
jgi:hypothetical protein